MTPEAVQAMIDQAMQRNSTNDDRSHRELKVLSACPVGSRKWNRTLGHEAAYAMTWETLKKKMTDKYCPRALMCTKFVFDENEKVDKYIGGLPDNIHGNVMSVAWEHFKDLLRACPHHGFIKLHQIDTFYNSLTPTNQDSLNAAADGNLLTKTPKDALTLIENKLKVRTSRNRPFVAKVSTYTSTSGLSPDVAALTDFVKALLLKNTTPPPSFVKVVEQSCVICGGSHPNYKCLATDGNTFPGYQYNIQAYVSAATQNNKLENMLSNYFQMNKPSGSGSLPSNTVTNPKGDLKSITTQSGVSYDGPPIPPPFSPPPKVVERGPGITKDLVQSSNEKVHLSDV
uniref:Reverse transcriptase domain-containing protein n=1 Tax=Tanacetum cinerariifolium TaxID=118510 RepID=A0A6L2LJY1_TANCI|nr:reverse transcriptase domain-containing protein [Tanacetum cinerariifolium]